MPYYETIFETGQKAVSFHDTDEEALQGAQNHHDRAKLGQPGRGKSTPRNDLGDDGQQQVMDYPAERIVKILKYDQHPSDYATTTLSADVANKELKELTKKLDQDGVVNLMELAAGIRDLTSPLVDEPAIQESMYKMPEVDELKVKG